MWDLPGPGLEPVSLALAGGFSSTGPPGKSGIHALLRVKGFHTLESQFHQFLLAEIGRAHV